MSYKDNNRDTYVKLSAKEKISYAIIDTADGFTWNFAASYLMYFYTDVFGISAAAVSLLMFISRFWDAVNDPIIGAMSDKTTSKYGRYRPWVLFGAVPLAVSMALLFWVPPFASQGAKLAYAYITYAVFVLGYTVVNIPYTALAANLTQDPDERGKLAGIRIAFALVGAILSAQAGTKLVAVLAGDSMDMAKGYFLTATVLALASVVLYIGGACGVKEVFIPEKKKDANAFKMIIQSMKNKWLLFAIVAHFLVGLTIYGRMAVVSYYFKYNVGRAELVSLFFVCMQLPMMAGSGVSAFIAEKLKSKGKALSLSFGIYGILTCLNSLVSPINAGAFFWMLLCVSNLFYGIGYAVTYSIIPDTVEYHEYKFGVRNEGISASLTSFWNKMGMAIGTSATAAILAALNYVPNGAQPQQTLNWINNITFLIPGIASVCVAIFFVFYKLDNKEYNRILQCIKDRKNDENK